MSIYAGAFALLLVACSALPVPQEDGVQQVEAQDGAADTQQARLQELESAEDLAAREKRAGGGNFLNELNKGPTYSQLLNQGGGGNKFGFLSGLLSSSSSSSGGASAGGGDGSGGSGSGSILGLITPLLGSSSNPAASLLGFDPFDLPGGDSSSSSSSSGGAGGSESGGSLLEDVDSAASSLDGDVSSVTAEPGSTEAAATEADLLEVDLLEAGSEVGESERIALGLTEHTGDGDDDDDDDNNEVEPYGGASAGGSVSLGDGEGIGASAGASIGGDGAAAGAGSDSGSILSLVTPILGSSSQGAASGGDGSAGGNPASAGIFGGGFLGTVLSTVFKIKGFIFRKIVQLLSSSSGSPQAG